MPFQIRVLGSARERVSLNTLFTFLTGSRKVARALQKWFCLLLSSLLCALVLLFFFHFFQEFFEAIVGFVESFFHSALEHSVSVSD